MAAHWDSSHSPLDALWDQRRIGLRTSSSKRQVKTVDVVYSRSLCGTNKDLISRRSLKRSRCVSTRGDTASEKSSGLCVAQQEAYRKGAGCSQQAHRSAVCARARHAAMIFHQRLSADLVVNPVSASSSDRKLNLSPDFHRLVHNYVVKRDDRVLFCWFFSFTLCTVDWILTLEKNSSFRKSLM